MVAGLRPGNARRRRSGALPRRSMLGAVPASSHPSTSPVGSQDRASEHNLRQLAICSTCTVASAGECSMRSVHPKLRRWLVGIAIACVALELLYLVAAPLHAERRPPHPPDQQEAREDADHVDIGAELVPRCRDRGRARDPRPDPQDPVVRGSRRRSGAHQPPQTAVEARSPQLGSHRRDRLPAAPPARPSCQGGRRGHSTRDQGQRDTFRRSRASPTPRIPNPRTSTPPRRSSRGRGPSTSAGSTSTDRFGSRSAACDSTARGSRPGP